ncbi:MAG: Rpn family recombination-promoting nuclease/putative transposase, partial [Anaerolineae bacterium]
DFVHQLIDEGGHEYLFHLEFQVGHEAGFPERMFTYAGALTQLFKKPVVSLAIFLRRRESSIPESYDVCLGDVLVNQYRYPALRLWDYYNEIWSGKYRQLAPLLLMVRNEADQAVLAQERELILQEQDTQKRADLLACAVTIGTRYFEKDFLWRFFRGEVEQLRGASFIEDWVQEGIEQGLEQGLERGIEQGIEQGISQGRKQECEVILMRILARRFGRLPAMPATRLETLPLEEVERLVDKAVEAPDLASFEEHLSAVSNGNGERKAPSP